MSAAGQSAFERTPGTAMPGSSFHSSKLSRQVPSSSRESGKGNLKMKANGLKGRIFVEARRNKTYADAKNARRDWLATEIARMSVAEVQAITGLTETAIHNIRRGKNNMSHDNLCALLEARLDFRTRFFCSVGGELLCRPDQYIAYERAVNAVMRGED